MLCMCWDHQATMDSSGENTGQCGTLGAARMAQEAGVKKLVLVHTGPTLSRQGEMEQGISDVKDTFGGEIVFAHELMTISMPPR
jgi:ribonuclease BN (tRNA processing enzyme)